MVYKWYILPIGGLYATYHLLPEPEKSIDGTQNIVVCRYVSFSKGGMFRFHVSFRGGGVLENWVAFITITPRSLSKLSKPEVLKFSKKTILHSLKLIRQTHLKNGAWETFSRFLLESGLVQVSCGGPLSFPWCAVNRDFFHFCGCKWDSVESHICGLFKSKRV